MKGKETCSALPTRHKCQKHLILTLLEATGHISHSLMKNIQFLLTSFRYKFWQNKTIQKCHLMGCPHWPTVKIRTLVSTFNSILSVFIAKEIFDEWVTSVHQLPPELSCEVQVESMNLIHGRSIPLKGFSIFVGICLNKRPCPSWAVWFVTDPKSIRFVWSFCLHFRGLLSWEELHWNSQSNFKISLEHHHNIPYGYHDIFGWCKRHLLGNTETTYLL